MEIKQPDSPFFLAVRQGICRKNNEIWYMKAPLGKIKSENCLVQQQTTQAFKEPEQKSAIILFGKQVYQGCQTPTRQRIL